ncbi:MAG: family 16 glycoside hydrolase [Phycisphaerales bacterium]
MSILLRALCCVVLAATPALAKPPGREVVPGVTIRVYEVSGDLKKIPELQENQTPNRDVVAPTIDLADAAAFGDFTGPIVTHVRTFIDIPVVGDYEFRLTSDDGSRLTFDGLPALDHDGRHGAIPKTGKSGFMAGSHELLIEHFDHGGKRALKLEWKPPGATEFTLVPTTNLWTDADNARVTSPGVKALKGDTRPGDGREVEGVHPAFTRTPILPDGYQPMVGSMAFLPDGRLVLGTFNPMQRSDTELPDINKKPPDKLWAMSGTATGDPEKVTVKPCADGVYEPLGLCVVDGKLYVAHRKAITQLTDTDGDGFFETHRDIGSGWEAWNYHQFAFGLVHKDGKFYTALSTAMAPPGWKGMGTNAAPNGTMRGCILEIDPAANAVSVYAGGCRTPNSIGLGPDNSLFYCDNQGTWMSTSQLCEVAPGRFFGHYNNTNFVPNLADRFPDGGAASAWCDRVRAPAAAYFPQNELANSPSEPLLVPSGLYAGQLLVGEITAGGIRRVFLEKINGAWQGAAFRFTQGLSCGINRMAWGPEGALYAGGIGANGNWSWKDKRFGLDRLAPSGKTAFEMLAVRAIPDGFEIEFTKPVDTAWLAKADNYTVTQWTYKPTAEYGGPKVDQQKLTVASTLANADGRRVRLTIPGLKTGRCVRLRLDPVSTEGEPIWSTEAWYALNAIPMRQQLAMATINGVAIAPESLGVGVLPPADAAVLIGRTTRNAMATAAELKNAPTEARTQAQIIAGPEYVEVGKGSGDLLSRTSFGDCRLHVEWYCPPGGSGQLAANSGVYIQERYELQVLGTLAGEAAPKNDEAGAIYKTKAADHNASTGPGTWQAYDIWFRAARSADGKKTEPARVTIYWNGVLVHNDVVIPGSTGAGKAETPDRAVLIGPLKLQDHESQAEGSVRYRNVWIAPLDAAPAITPGEWQTLDAAAVVRDWRIRSGPATFIADGGEIVGRSVPNSTNTFLVSPREYGDFELLLEFKQHADLNSGVQVRSSVEGGWDNRPGKVIGYQVELDPSARAYTGGLYDEARRGWLYPLIDNPSARRAYRPGEWNTLRIVAQGPHVRTWLNGVPAADAFDAIDATGRIALQVHGVGDKAEPMEVRFRNVRLRELDSR